MRKIVLCLLLHLSQMAEHSSAQQYLSLTVPGVGSNPAGYIEFHFAVFRPFPFLAVRISLYK